MKNINKDLRTTILRRSYLVAIFLMIFLFILIIITRTSNGVMKNTDSYISIEDQWTLTPGGDDYVDTSNLKQYFQKDSDTLSIFWEVPAIKYDKSLIFRSKDVYCQIFIHDKLAFSTSYYKSRLYTASPGNNWNIFTISNRQEGQTVELVIKYVYDSNSITADHFYWGNKSDWVLDFFMDKILAIFLSILIIFIGIIILLMDRGSFGKSGKHSLLYLGLYAILMGLWSLVETNTLQFIFKDGRLLQLLDNILMVTDSLPLFFYLDAEFDIFQKKGLQILALVDLIYIYICILGQLTGLTDLHNLLQGSWIATGLSFFVLMMILIHQFIAFRHGEKIKKSVIIQMIGFCALMIIVIISLPIYVTSDGMDRAQSIRFGMLVMIIMFAIAGQIQTYELIQQGTRFEIVKNLAYQDVLTGLNNRTSYLETLEQYRSNPPEKLGMIFFDVNNLKLANDNYGHETGDQLICAAAKIIQDSFGDIGKAFRTGGDEFIVFLEGNDPTKSYENGLDAFYKNLDQVNELHKFPFKVQIAQGFAQREAISEMYLQLMIETADTNMYANKKKIKETT